MTSAWQNNRYNYLNCTLKAMHWGIIFYFSMIMMCPLYAMFVRSKISNLWDFCVNQYKQHISCVFIWLMKCIKRLKIFSIIVNSVYPLCIFIYWYEKVPTLALSDCVYHLRTLSILFFSIIFPFMKINDNQLIRCNLHVLYKYCALVL